MVKDIIKQQKFIMAPLLVFMSFTVFSAQEETPTSDKKIIKEPSAAVSFKARSDHDFLLTADYYFLGKKIDNNKSPGVIVLHDCHSQRSRYSELAKAISAQSVHVLSLDFRGYGDSVASCFSQLEIKKQAKDIVSYQSEIALITSYWADDLTAAHQFLRTKVDKSKGIAVVASGCAAGYVVSMAEKTHLRALVLLTPEMSYADKERYKNLIDIPSYFISSAHHIASISTAQELFDWNGATRSKMQVFKGDRSNYKLIKANQYLVNDVAQWLKFTLR